jgi:hypothetical protein
MVFSQQELKELKLKNEQGNLRQSEVSRLLRFFFDLPPVEDVEKLRKLVNELQQDVDTIRETLGRLNDALP